MCVCGGGWGRGEAIGRGGKPANLCSGDGCGFFFVLVRTNFSLSFWLIEHAESLNCDGGKSCMF